MHFIHLIREGVNKKKHILVLGMSANGEGGGATPCPHGEKDEECSETNKYVFGRILIYLDFLLYGGGGRGHNFADMSKANNLIFFIDAFPERLEYETIYVHNTYVKYYGRSLRQISVNHHATALAQLSNNCVSGYWPV